MSSLVNRMISDMFDVSKFIAETTATPMSSSFTSHGVEELRTVKRAQQIERKLHQWGDDASASMSFQTSPLSRDQRFSGPPDCYHIYSDIWTLATWNKYRVSRLLLHQILLERYQISSYSEKEPDGSELGRICQHSLFIIQKMINDICASIPSVLGDIKTSGDNTCPPSLGGYFTTWALLAVARCPFASADQRDWVQNILLRISREFGIISTLIPYTST